MLDGYFDAFEHYLGSGNHDGLAEFFEADANPEYLSVYRNGDLRTRVEALVSSYPVTLALVGDDLFRALARAYVDANPATSGTLVGYGADFDAFLRACPEKHGLAYLPDVAAIDAAWLRSTFAAEASALNGADIETLGSEGVDVTSLRVTLTPSVQRVHLLYDIGATWALIRDQGELTQAVDLEQRDNTVMLWRLGGTVHIKTLEPGEASFLAALSEIATLEDAAGRAFETDGAFDLANTFAALLENQVLKLEGQE